MNNSYIFSHDPLLLRVRDADETIELFGEDFLEEYGHVVPENLLIRYKAAWSELMQIQDELKMIYEKAEKYR